MIEKVSDNAGVSPATDLTQKSAGGKILVHELFGDVMVDELTTPNLAGIFRGGRSDAASATAAAQAAVVTAAAQAAVVTATAQAAVATSTAQVAAATSTARAALASSDPQAADPSSAPTAQAVFGAHPWLTAPTGVGPDGLQYAYNPIYFATRQTANQIAAMVDGQVVEENAIAPNGPFQQQEPNEMIQLSNGQVVNAGLIADFYDHGYPQSYIDMLVQNEIQGT